MGKLASDRKMVMAGTYCVLYQTVSYCTLGDEKKKQAVEKILTFNVRFK